MTVYPQGRKGLWSWAMLDWANSAFAIVVMTAFFPAFFKDYWCAAEPPMPAERSTELLGYFNSASSLVIALMAPILGSIADQGNSKKRFLAFFTFLGAAATALLPMAARGHYWMAGLLYAVAALGFSGNNMFYDSLLPEIAGEAEFDRASALGYSLGYLGSGMLFLLNIVMVTQPARFGFAGPAQAVNACFVLTAAWWALFSLPAFLFIKETPAVAPTASGGGVMTRGFAQLWATFHEIKGDRMVLTFLAGFVLYNDAVNTIIKMAVDYGKSIGLDNAGMFKALLITQFVGFPAAIFFGRMGERIGPKRGILAGLAVYAVVCFWGWRMTTQREFYIMAVVIGLVQGGVQSLSRSYFARMIPPEKGGEYFGFYNTLGKFAAVIGPALMGVTARLTDSRSSILSLLILIVGGGAILSRVRDKAPA